MKQVYQAPEQRRELTRADYDRYRIRMSPYDKKVDNRELLSDEDMQILEAMRGEIEAKYTVESLSRVRFDGYLTGYLDSILNLDELMKRNIEDSKLEAEIKEIENKIYNPKNAKSLAPEERKRLGERRDEICYMLDPCHFHGLRP